MKFSDCIDAYILDMRRAGRLNSPRSERTYRDVLNLHADDVGNRDPRTTGREDVKRTLSRWTNPNTIRGRRAGNRLACPECLSPEFLGENALGWRGVREARMVAGEIKVALSESRVYDAERVSWFCSGKACNIDRELRDSDLVQIDAEGKPVPQQPKEQEALDV